MDVQRFLCFRMAGGADPQFIVSRPEPGIAYDAFRCGRPCLFEAVQLVFIQALHVLVDGALRQEAERQVVLMCCQADFMGKGHGLLQDVAIVSWHYGQVVDQQGRKVRREQAALLKFLQWEECDPLRVAHIHQPAVGEQPAAVYHGGPGRAAFQFERPGLIFSGRKQGNACIPQHQQPGAVHRMDGITIVAGKASVCLGEALQRLIFFIEQVKSGSQGADIDFVVEHQDLAQVPPAVMCVQPYGLPVLRVFQWKISESSRPHQIHGSIFVNVEPFAIPVFGDALKAVVVDVQAENAFA